MQMRSNESILRPRIAGKSIEASQEERQDEIPDTLVHLGLGKRATLWRPPVFPSPRLSQRSQVSDDGIHGRRCRIVAQAPVFLRAISVSARCSQAVAAGLTIGKPFGW
jgi:hypothetical protein